MNRETVSHETQELYLYALNDEKLYTQQRESIESNLEKKFARGIYDREKAMTLWKYFADNAAKKYHEKFCNSGKWYKTFPTQDRLEMARLCESEHYDLMLVREGE
jgi:hypothetical protein